MIDLNELSMRIAVGQFSELTEEQLAFAVQCGAKDIQLNTPRLPGTERWEYEDLKDLADRTAAYGLRLICIENVPISFYDKIMTGAEGREQQLENMQAIVRNMGKAGIPILGYHWMPNGVWRTSFETKLRGGATANEFRMNLAKTELTHGRVYTEEEIWANYDWYLERMLPVCEEVGVRMALHPDDPPVPMLGGVARIFTGFEGFKRAMDTHPSKMHGLDFCHGCWSEMRNGAGILEAIEHFGKDGRILYVHMRDVQGCADDFQECFLGEGNSNIPAVLRRLKSVGFNGFILDDHVPFLVNDSSWGHRGRALSTGYIAGVLATINDESE